MSLAVLWPNTAKTCASPALTNAVSKTSRQQAVKSRTRPNARQLVILTGLSGSGKSTVLHAFEDMGFYCVDNLPVELIPIFAELHAAGDGDFARAALLVDAREGQQLDKLPPLLRHLKKDHPITLVFIDAAEDALLRRQRDVPPESVGQQLLRP
jgi:UPF0042 nucleotide-binding protein